MIFLTATSSSGSTLSEAFKALFTLVGIIQLISLAGLLILVALITWVVKTVWNAGSNKKQKRRHQNPTYYNDWVIAEKRRKSGKSEIKEPSRLYPSKTKDSKDVYGTGWTYNEYTKLWEPPDHLKG